MKWASRAREVIEAAKSHEAPEDLGSASPIAEVKFVLWVVYHQKTKSVSVLGVEVSDLLQWDPASEGEDGEIQMPQAFTFEKPASRKRKLCNLGPAADGPPANAKSKRQKIEDYKSAMRANRNVCDKNEDFTREGVAAMPLTVELAEILTGTKQSKKLEEIRQRCQAANGRRSEGGDLVSLIVCNSL